jgi:hypothetical protein
MLKGGLKKIAKYVAQNLKCWSLWNINVRDVSEQYVKDVGTTNNKYIVQVG